MERRDSLSAAETRNREAQTDAERRQQQEFNQALLSAVAQDHSSGLSVAMIIGIAVVGVVVLFGFAMLAFMFIRNSQQQQQMFQYTVQQSQPPPREYVSLPIYTAPMIEDARPPDYEQDRKLLPGHAPDMGELKTLIQRCRDISSDIDHFTHRKNATRNVAELVYKVSTYLGYDEQESILFLAVGMVYDIGFLEMDEGLFTALRLTEEQFESVKAHPALGERRLGFVPDEFKPVFRAGVLMHHENLDGSGYPSGVSGDDVPYIARVIHAAESFIAMTSQREFRQIMTKTEALDALMAETDKYDANILNAISNVV